MKISIPGLYDTNHVPPDQKKKKKKTKKRNKKTKKTKKKKNKKNFDGILNKKINFFLYKYLKLR